MTSATSGSTFAAIDVGTNAARLELGRARGDGTLDTLLREREAICPGEGVFTQGVMSQESADRLVGTLRRFAAVCAQHGARVRAVATSALREAGNRAEVLQRVRAEAGLELEVISGQEEARLICLGVLHRVPPRSRSLVMDLGGGSTEVVLATGSRPEALWSLPLGGVRLTELFVLAEEVTPTRLRAVRGFVERQLNAAFSPRPGGLPREALGSSGTIRNVVRFASAGHTHATAAQLALAVETLARMTPEQRREHFEPQRAEVIVAGALLLEQSVRHLGLEGITAVQRGLRDGLLVELASAHPGATPPQGTLTARFEKHVR